MTTSFSHFVRGNFARAARANPAGLLLAGLCALQIVWGAASVAAGRLMAVHYPGETAFAVLLVLVVAVGANWLVQLVTEPSFARVL